MFGTVFYICQIKFVNWVNADKIVLEKYQLYHIRNTAMPLVFLHFVAYNFNLCRKLLKKQRLGLLWKFGKVVLRQ